MDLEQRVELVCRRPTEEVLTVEELRTLLQAKNTPVAYNGFEPSGLMHLGTGLATALKVKDFTSAGIKFKILLATWHAWLNNKMGGDMEKIRMAAHYFIEGWTSLGVDPSNVEFVMSDDLINQPGYWTTLLRISEKVTLANVTRALPIMGRKQGEAHKFGAYLYPLMQVTDIFQLKADITQLGMDQRKANIIAKEVGPSLGFWSPVAVHHHLLSGLTGPSKMDFDTDPVLDRQISSKMAKSRPDSAIFIHDSEEDLRAKIKKAYCPERVVDDNPIIDYAQNLILRTDTELMAVNRPSSKGGPLEVTLAELKNLYSKGEIHPLDLKEAVADCLVRLLEPARKAFKGKEERLQQFAPK
ncbi:MAG: tyrosine--tRNA ligase [Thermoprotei archaeon]